MTRTAPVSEIFSSVQGEGIYAGCRQIFVRFAGCNQRCDYCDEPAASAEAPFLEAGEVMSRIERLRAGAAHHSVSFTGGEPLLRAEFLAELMPQVRRLGLKTYLETNATLPHEFQKVGAFTDIVSADIKLPSATGAELWREHEEFLALCAGKTFVKIVVTGKTRFEEFCRAVALISLASRAMPLVIQPATKNAGAAPPPEEFTEQLRAFAASKLGDVRVLGQQHPIWGVK